MLTTEKIQQTVPAQWGYSFADLVARTDRREVNYARDMFCYFMRKKTDTTLVNIGKMLGNRDYSTIIGSIKNINKLIAVYPEVKADIRKIDEKLKEELSGVG